MPPWTIQVTWTDRDDDNKPFRARSVFQCEADSILDAYAKAETVKDLKPTAVFGAIIPGHHSRL